MLYFSTSNGLKLQKVVYSCISPIAGELAFLSLAGKSVCVFAWRRRRITVALVSCITLNGPLKVWVCNSPLSYKFTPPAKSKLHTLHIYIYTHCVECVYMDLIYRLPRELMTGTEVSRVYFWPAVKSCVSTFDRRAVRDTCMFFGKMGVVYPLAQVCESASAPVIFFLARGAKGNFLYCTLCMHAPVLYFFALKTA